LENLLIAVGGVKSNDQRLSRQKDDDQDSPYRSIRSGKTYATSAEKDADDTWD
jgi:hypothetical protein